VSQFTEKRRKVSSYFWQPSDEQRLKELYATTTNLKISEIIGRSTHAISSKAKQLKLKKSKSHIQNLNAQLSGSMEIFTKQDLEELYITKKLSTTTIGQIYNCASQTIWHWLKNYGIKRRTISESKIGIIPWNKGLSKELDSRVQKYAKSLAGRKFSVDHRKNLSKSCMGRKSPLKGVKKPKLAILNGNPEFIKKRLAGLLKRPTKLEEKLIRIITEQKYPLKYTGNGSKIIGTLCPDFHHETLPKVVEVFGETYHDPTHSPFRIPSIQQEKPRIAIYRKMGYECLVVWGKEFENEALLLDKINNFLGVKPFD